MTRVGPDTEEVFHDQFWDSLDFVVNAVDNINARLYVDSKCVWYCKPLMESGIQYNLFLIFDSKVTQ